jgi:hypothetical protein
VAERARRLDEMKEILASFRDALKDPEPSPRSQWTTAAPARAAPAASEVEKVVGEVAGLRLSAVDEESGANLIVVDHVEALEGADDGGEAASSHALAMRLGHLDEVRWRVAAMSRLPDPPRAPSQAEAIRRVIHDNVGLLRLCYDDGLRHDPSLQGRVVVKFAIAPNGGTEFAADGGSDLPDPGVVECVVRAFSNLSFTPPGARVVVVYPLVFRPEADTK